MLKIAICFACLVQVSRTQYFGSFHTKTDDSQMTSFGSSGPGGNAAGMRMKWDDGSSSVHTANSNMQPVMMGFSHPGSFAGPMPSHQTPQNSMMTGSFSGSMQTQQPFQNSMMAANRRLQYQGTGRFQQKQNNFVGGKRGQRNSMGSKQMPYNYQPMMVYYPQQYPLGSGSGGGMHMRRVSHTTTGDD